jgi:2-polyprenyl-3-methyl-5-hydroxy-6-metoxy-1,4-benzoquinol methylase
VRFEDVIFESCPCPLGCKPNDELIVTAGDRINGLPGLFRVVRCQDCGLMRTDPRPTPSTIGFYYPDDYGPYLGTRAVSGLNSNRPPLWKRRLRQAFKRVAQTDYLPLMEPGRMLELGCASGAFLQRMARDGWDVTGIEFSAAAAKAARCLGFQVHAGLLETAPDPEQPFDLVAGWMVFEHLHDPIGALRILHPWLKRDGWLVLAMPNAASIERAIFRDRWLAYHLPNHLFHFTPASLAMILDKGGFKLERVFHQRLLSNAIASTGYLLKDRKAAAHLAERLIKFPERGKKLHYVLFPLAFALSMFGQTGRMTVWARKKHD